MLPIYLTTIGFPSFTFMDYSNILDFLGEVIKYWLSKLKKLHTYLIIIISKWKENYNLINQPHLDYTFSCTCNKKWKKIF